MLPTEPDLDDDFVRKLAELDESIACGEPFAARAILGDCAPEQAARLAANAALLRALQRARHLESAAHSPPCDANGSAAIPRASAESASNPPPPARHPRSLGRFEIERELGRGGYGIVYLAHDRQLHRLVALKVPRLEALLDERLSERFELEARAAGGLAHPNIVSVYEVDLAAPVCYIATEYVDGPTLLAWMKSPGNAFTPRQAAALAADLAEAVHHAHLRGVLHRDIKPGNILLAPLAATQAVTNSSSLPADQPNSNLLSFVPKLTDFGLA